MDSPYVPITNVVGRVHFVGMLQTVLFADLLWPEGEEALSEVAQRAIEELLNPEPMCRSGAAGKPPAYP